MRASILARARTLIRKPETVNNTGSDSQESVGSKLRYHPRWQATHNFWHRGVREGILSPFATALRPSQTVTLPGCPAVSPLAAFRIELTGFARL